MLSTESFCLLSQFFRRPKRRAIRTGGANGFHLLRRHRRGLVAEVRPNIAQHIRHLLIIQSHWRHRQGCELFEFLAVDADRAAEAMQQHFDQALRITAGPIAADDGRIDARQSLALGLMSVQAKRVIHELARMIAHRCGAGDLLNLGAALRVAS